MAAEGGILVVGSVSMDLVMRSHRIPSPGETVMGNAFATSCGGKGANQAVAIARLGERCRFLGRVGDDFFGQTLLARMKREGVDCANLVVTPEAPTGIAIVIVNSSGENTTILAGGANALVTPDDVFSREKLFEQSAVVLLQLELPLPTVRAAMDLARRHKCRIVLDPTPAIKPMPPELMQVDVISPNVRQAGIITGTMASEERQDKLVASNLIEMGAKAAVLKLGPRGCLVVMADGHFYRVPTYSVDVVDPTGAGDAFTAALAVAIAQGQHMHQGAKFANAAGSLTCTKHGLQEALPTLSEVKMLMQDQPL